MNHKRTIKLYVLICCSLVVSACVTTPPPQIPHQRPAKIALVLGAGASKGFAHVGVLKILESNKVPIQMIVGTSVGSFVGSLYAYGYDAYALQKISMSIEMAIVSRSKTKRSHSTSRRGAGQLHRPLVALNPDAALPAMVDGDWVPWESNAILQYAADKVSAESAYPRDLQTRADINRWLLWESSSWFPSCHVFVVENCVKPLLGSHPDAAVLDAQAAQFHKLAGHAWRAVNGSRPITRRLPTSHSPRRCTCTAGRACRSPTTRT